MSLLQNDNYNKRLLEKLERQAKKRGVNSPAAEELAHVKNAGSESPQKRERVTETKDKQEK